MTPKNTPAVLAAVTEAAGKPNAAWIAQLWKNPSLRADVELRCTLASRSPDAPIVYEIVKDPEPRVRIALLSNRNLCTATVTRLIAEESRSSVLAQLLRDVIGERSHPNVATIRDTVIKALQQKPTAGMAEALLDVTDHLDDANGLIVAEVMLRRKRTAGSQDREAALRRLLEKLSAEHADRLVRIGGMGAHLRLLVPHLRDADHDWEQLVAAATDDQKGELHAGASWRRDGALNSYVNALQLFKHDGAKAAVQHRFATLLESETVKNNPRMLLLLQRAAGAVTEAAGSVEEMKKRFEAEDSTVYPAIVADGRFDTEFRLSALQKMHASAAVRALLELTDPPAELVDDLAVRETEAFLDGGARKLVGDDTARWTRLALSAIGHAGGRYSWRYSASPVFQLALCGGDDALGALPWGYVAEKYQQRGYNTPESDRHATARITEMVCEALGEESAAWEAFVVLAENYQGSISQLLAAACLLNPKA